MARDVETLFGKLEETSPKPKARNMAPRVDEKKTARRYYLHKQLDKKMFAVRPQKFEIETVYASFEDIPVGQQRYILNQLFKQGYSIYYGLPARMVVRVKKKKL